MKDLERIYISFEEAAREYRTGQACGKGCSFCCSHAGSIDMTTLEGVRIRDAVQKFPRPRQKNIEKILYREVREREKGNKVPCPFLMKNNACMIYEVRPFSCRRVYSLHVCTREHPPQVNRKVMEIAQDHIRQLQTLDSTGYSGHISYILHMLDAPAFFTTYQGGGFKPEEITVFGKSHNIIINRSVI